ncbi:unnamed protein product [Onchocerca flexuosa]|uniref:RanBD1 domain-containing protein n=1 Tax=Onchocerca flexuosa TaxID=387005 RepID=A0A183HMB3_9BILA|nr:unnamed protein product [Onchocerca flexuosa]
MPNQIALSSPFSSPLNSSATETIFKKDFNNKDDSKTKIGNGGFQKKDMDNVKETNTNKTPLFLFSQENNSKKNELPTNPPNFVFNKSSSEKELAENSSEKKVGNEESAGKSYVTPVFSFLKPVVTEGNHGCSDSLKPKLEFKFGAPPIIQSEPDNESEESEYVPPKPTAVLTEEPKAIFSSKCSVFVLKGTEYEKLGIGQLHIKIDETDSEKKILLIRAATTVGKYYYNYQGFYLNIAINHEYKNGFSIP